MELDAISDELEGGTLEVNTTSDGVDGASLELDAKSDKLEAGDEAEMALEKADSDAMAEADSDMLLDVAVSEADDDEPGSLGVTETTEELSSEETDSLAEELIMLDEPTHLLTKIQQMRSQRWRQSR